MSIISAISWQEQFTLRWNDDVRFVLDMSLHSDIILIMNQPVFVLKCCMVSMEKQQIPILFKSDPSGAWTHDLPHLKRAHYYTTNAVQGKRRVMMVCNMSKGNAPTWQIKKKVLAQTSLPAKKTNLTLLLLLPNTDCLQQVQRWRSWWYLAILMWCTHMPII